MNPVTHERARAWLHEGQSRLRAQEQIELDNHLASCPECQAYAARLADLAPALTGAMRARWDGIRPPAGPRFSDRLPAAQKRALVPAWLTSLVLTGALTVLAALALARPGLLGQLGLVSSPTASAPATIPSPAPSATHSGPAAVQALLLTLTPDEANFMVRPVDPATLADLPGYAPINLWHYDYPYTLSPDGRFWAVIAWPSDPFVGGGVLHLIDTAAWRDITTSVTFSESVNNLVFSPDGSRLAATESGDRVDASGDHLDAQLVIVNVQQPNAVHMAALDIISQRAAFSADGKAVVLYGTPWPKCVNAACLVTAAPHVMGFDAASGKGLWDLTLDEVKDGDYAEPITADPKLVNFYQPGLAFSGDGRWLYVVHAQDEGLTTIDLAAGAARTTAIVRPVSWLDQLVGLTAATAYAKGEPVGGAVKSAVLSTDGTRLYVTGYQSQVISDTTAPDGRKQVDTPLDPEVVDPLTGQRLTDLETALAGQKGMDLLPSIDGRWLYGLRQSSADPRLPMLTILDAATLHPVAQLANGALDLTLTFAPDGQFAYLTSTDLSAGSTTHLQVIRASNGQIVARRDVGSVGQVIVLPPIRP